MRIQAGLARLEIFLFAGLLIVAMQSAVAVDRFVDGNSGSDSGNNCTNSGNPCATVQRAIDSAQAGDTVRVADATYTEILTVDKALSIRGESRTGTILQAATQRLQAAERVISVADNTAFELSDATVRHGNSGLNGGGLECMGGDLLIERVLFTQNDAEEAGGGLASGDNVVVMNDVAFRDNGNGDTESGGGASLGVNFEPTDVTLSNVSFDNNTVGGIGGGLELFGVQATLTDVVFIGNASVGDNGGGLAYRERAAGDLQLRDVVFAGNSAQDFGGGMYTLFDTPYTMFNVVFSGNLASLGGGLYNQGGTDGERILTNVTMSGNRAILRGGAIDRPRDMTFRNTVIWNNRDETGTGTAEATMDDFFSDSVVEVSNSLLQGYPANEFPGSSNNLDGTDPGNNPLFRAAVNPAGAPSLAGNLRLQQGSPVRDQGNNSFVTGVDTDLDGEARIFGGAVDLGPYEGTDLIFADGFEDSNF